MATLGSLVVSLEANIAKFESAMTKAEYAAKKSSDNIVGVLKVVGVAAAGMFSISAMDKAFTRITDMEAALLKTAAKLGTTVETLSSLGVVVRKTGMDNELFNTSLVRLEKNISNAAKGLELGSGKFDEWGEEIGKGSTALRELGLNAQILNNLPLDQQLMAISAAMVKQTNESDKLRLTLELFGKGGAAMLIPLKEGPEAFQKMIDKMISLGIITTDMAKRGAEAKTAAGDLTAAWSNFAKELTDTVAPAITLTLKLLTQMIQDSREGKSAMQQVYTQDMWNLPGPEAPKTKSTNMITKMSAEGFPYSIKVAPWQAAIQPPDRSGGTKAGGAGAKGGKSAKEEAQTVVDLFEQLSWGAEDADKALALCAERLTKMQDNQERLISGQAKYASEMAGLSPLLTTQLGYKEQALEKEHQLKLATLERELFEKKISRAVHDQELGMAALVNQAKKYSLEREKWATQGIGGGIKILQMEMAKESEVWVSKAFIEGFRGAQNFIENSLSGVLKGALRGEKTDLKKFGFAIADYTVDGMVKLAMRPLAKLFTGALQTAFTKVGGEALGAAFGDALGSIAGGVAGGVAGEAAGAAALSGAAALLSGSSLLLDGSSMLLDGSSLLLDGAAISLGIAADMLIFAAAMDAVPFFHSGGMVMHGGGPIYAHAGWPKLAHDERRIIAQTGERVLSRAQNRDYEAGGRSGGGGNVTVQVNQQVLQSLDRREIRRSARDLVRETEREMRRLGRG